MTDLPEDDRPENDRPEDDRPEAIGPEDDVSDAEDAEVDDPEEEEGFSLEELGAAYKHLAEQSDNVGDGERIEPGEVLQREDLLAVQASEAASAMQSQEDGQGDNSERATPLDDELRELDEEEDAVASPEAIVEAALFVGHPESLAVTSTRLASIMRDITVEEVEQIIDDLNVSYREQEQGIRIVQSDEGYKMVVAPEVESVRLAFSGKVRETQLNQPAIEVLSLVAYQPGITAAECTDLRGRDSGSLLNQMVRRRLVEMRREPLEPESVKMDDSDAKPGKKKKAKIVSRFYPAERLLVLLGLESLEDLPQVEEVHLN